MLKLKWMSLKGRKYGKRKNIAVRVWKRLLPALLLNHYHKIIQTLAPWLDIQWPLINLIHLNLKTTTLALKNHHLLVKKVSYQNRWVKALIQKITIINWSNKSKCSKVNYNDQKITTLCSNKNLKNTNKIKMISKRNISEQTLKRMN